MTNKTVPVELLPCPFCGAAPEIQREGNEHTTKRRVVIRCPDCRVERANAGIRNTMDWLEEISITQWNRRAALAPEPEVCEWREDEEGQWFAECGAAWTFFEAGPDDNGMSFCYCCGKALLPITYQQYVKPEDAPVEPVAPEQSEVERL